MSQKDWMPRKDAELLAWSVDFSAGITAMGAAVGLLPAQCTAFAALQASFASSLATATNPATRTRGAISLKNDKRGEMKFMARELARIVNAFPGTTNQMRIDLGLNPRTGEASPINPPTEPPVMEVVHAIGRTLKVKVHGTDTTRRGKPEGVSGCTVFYFVGSTPPADITQWVFAGSSTRTVFDVEFPATVPAGAQVFLCSFWKNYRDQSGPACQPITAYLAGGVTGTQQHQAA
jgi:hypothetical protein